MTDTALDRVAAIAEAGRIDEAWSLATAWFAERGFARVTYGLTRFRTERSIGDLDDILYLTTADPAYSAFYFRDGFYATTPVYRWLLRNSGATTWRWVAEAYAEGRLAPEESEAVRRNAAFDVVAGVSFAFPDARERTRGALGLTADRGMTHDDVDRIWAAEGPAIRAVAHVLHLKVLSLPATAARRDLTARQAEMLSWVADGKTAQDIATILGLSAAAVEKHLRLAREALGVETTAQAVAKAVLLNLLPADPARKVGNPRLS
jgi:LuxR family transcriptional regulator